MAAAVEEAMVSSSILQKSQSLKDMKTAMEIKKLQQQTAQGRDKIIDEIQDQ